MSDSVQPHRRQPTRLPRPWDSPGKNTRVGCHFLLQCVKVKSLSCVRLLVTPWTAAHQAPPPMGFSRQEYWSGTPSPSPICIIYIQNKRNRNKYFLCDENLEFTLSQQQSYSSVILIMLYIISLYLFIL